jgi:hypothetical protein
MMGAWSSKIGASFDRQVDRSDAGYRNLLRSDISRNSAGKSCQLGEPLPIVAYTV